DSDILSSNGPHTDHHALAFDKNGNLWDGNDGGVWLLTDNDPTDPEWSDLNSNLQITQFNTIALDPFPFSFPGLPVRQQVFGASQDNGAETFDGSGTWTMFRGGDGGFIRADPLEPGTFYLA